MSELRAKVAYLHGLAEGLDIDETSAEGRVLVAMLDVLGDLAEAVDEVTDAQDELADYVEEMDDDLSAMEETVFEEDVIVDTGGEGDFEMVCCDSCGETIAASAGEFDGEELEVTCPVCGCAMDSEEHV